MITSNTKSRHETLVDILHRRAVDQSNQSAYIFLKDGEQEQIALTYSQLDQKARNVASLLHCHVEPGTPVILLFQPGLDFVSAFMGCLYAGMIAVPVQLPRRRHLARFSAIVNDCCAKLVLTSSSERATLRRLLDECAMERDLLLLATDQDDTRQAAEMRSPVSPSSLAMLQYTSGSTQNPRGVEITHRNLISNQRTICRAFEHTENSNVVGWLPHYHDMGLIGNVLQSLYVGVPCVLMSPAHFLERPVRWLQAISRFGATTSGAPNFAYHLCLREVTNDQRDELDLSSWTVAFNGAEPIRYEVLREFATYFRPCGFRLESFYPCYGLAEATLLVSGSKKGKGPRVISVVRSALEQGLVKIQAVGSHDTSNLTSCGRAVGQRVCIVDPGTGAEQDAGCLGEIWVAGPNVARGYWNRLTETERCFSGRLPRFGNKSFLRTGDLGFFRDGQLFVAGRIKDLIILRGRNLYPQDIETTVEASHSSLRPNSAAAFSVDAAHEEQLTVVQEVHRGCNEEQLSEILTAISNSVTREYEVRVHTVVLVKQGSIPKTSSGKIQRYLCRKYYLEGSLPVIARSDTTTPVRSEQAVEDLLTDFERLLASLWAEILKVERVSRWDNFLDLGGDSIAAVRLIVRIHQATGIKCSPDIIFETSTLGGLAEAFHSHIKMLNRCHPLAIPRAECHRPPSLSFAQERLWFLHERDPASPLYNMPGSLCLTGPLAVEALRQSLETIVHRHESLRTSFRLYGTQMKQEISSQSPLQLTYIDLGAVDPERRMQVAQSLIGEEQKRAFDLGRYPLFRVLLFQLGHNEHVLHLNLHHIIGDGWSFTVLLEEMSALYNTYTAGKVPSLRELPIQYGDFAVWQRQWLQGSILDEHIKFWRSKLSDLPMLQLPADHPRPNMPTLAGHSEDFTFDPLLALGLKQLGREEQATLFVIVFSAFNVALHAYFGQEDLAVGTHVAGRDRPETEHMIGCFINTVVVRTDVSGNPTFREVVQRARATIHESSAYGMLPFQTLVQVLKPRRDLSRNPLFQVLVDFDNRTVAPVLHGLTITRLNVPRRKLVYDIVLLIRRGESGPAGELVYNPDLFESRTIKQMVRYLITVLDTVVKRPNARLDELRSILATGAKKEYDARRKTFRNICQSKLKTLT